MHESAVPIRAVVLDVDGTVVTCPYDFNAMRVSVAELAAAYGVDTATLGVRGVLEQIDATAAKLGSPDGDVFRQRAEAAVEAIEVSAAATATFLPGAREALEELRARGLGIALITRNCRPASERVLTGFACYDILLARNDVPRPKPDPDHVLRSLDGLGETAEHAVMVGDYAYDLEAGAAAGVQLCVGVRTGGATDESLFQAGADVVLDSLADLPAWLAAREGGRA